MSNLYINQVNDDIMYDAGTRFVFPTIYVVFSIKDIDAKYKDALNNYLNEALCDELYAEGGLYLCSYQNKIISVRYETTDIEECNDEFLLTVRDLVSAKLNEFVLLNGGYEAIKA